MSIAKALRDAELQARVQTLEARVVLLEARVDELLRQVQELLARRRRTREEPEVTT